MNLEWLQKGNKLENKPRLVIGKVKFSYFKKISIIEVVFKKILLSNQLKFLESTILVSWLPEASTSSNYVVFFQLLHFPFSNVGLLEPFLSLTL